MLSGGRVLKTLRGEVKRAARLNVVPAFELNPFIALLDDIRRKKINRVRLRTLYANVERDKRKHQHIMKPIHTASYNT